MAEVATVKEGVVAETERAVAAREARTVKEGVVAETERGRWRGRRYCWV